MAGKDLDFKTKSCWETLTGKKHQKAMDALCSQYRTFLSVCKTEREVIDFVRNKILSAGYREDFSFPKVFRILGGKTIFMARKGKAPLGRGFRLIGAHADSPRLDFKQRPLYEECAVGLAKTHYYGGIRKYQWLSRPLALHGVVVKKSGETIVVCIGEDAEDPVFTVLDLLPHLASKQMNKRLSTVFEAEKLNVVLGHAPAKNEKKNDNDKKEKDAVKKKILEMLHKRYNIVEEDLFSAEIQAVPAGPAREVGLDGSLLGGYGQDDRICVHAALSALLSGPAPAHTQVIMFWDKEEIGSDGATGAKSLFFEYCLKDLIHAWSPKTRLNHVFMNSKAVSADVHAAMDPDYQDVHEKLNAALLGHGPCFSKFTGHRGKVGANDASAEYVAWLRNLLDTAGVPWQMAELGKVDMGGGGTVAKFLAIYGMDVIDFGPPVLSMHSPFEISSKMDLYASMLAYKAFLGS